MFGWMERGPRFAIALLGACALFTGCASVPTTKVTLLPDHDGHVGAVTVSNAQGQQRIDQAFNTVDVAKPTVGPGAARAVDQASFETAHRTLIDAQPSPPRSFVLNFLFDSMELTPESKRMLPEVLETVRARIPTEVTVFGYADSSGTAEYNLKLSAERARAVERVLRKIDPNLKVEVQYFGDRVPLVPSPPGVPEPRNRRAEIVIL
ncbi:Outer membrane protein OmpA [Pseudoxanthomonas sp. GM95]|uniref:OmpA family protein n=1 Tax=Pseudoxanthomonas sp. GM95 TaxID=1881043 RepID=UPI0008B58822|nr:OmpA family protein [Pseudoxanthomonas sp. GM95]SEL79779.1 Outer membrane protein OmpA [Pseudoxanthomonas sp. GM95]